MVAKGGQDFSWVVVNALNLKFLFNKTTNEIIIKFEPPLLSYKKEQLEVNFSNSSEIHCTENIEKLKTLSSCHYIFTLKSFP